MLLAAVGDLLGKPVDLVERLSEKDRRNTVVRVRTTDGPAAGTTFIVKQTVGFDVPEAADDLRRRFYQEATAAMFLTRIAPGEHVPRCHGVDSRLGLMIFEDLGSAPDLAGALLGENGPAARSSLVAYARRLGALHAATAGRMQIWDEVVTELGAPIELHSDRALQAHAEALDGGIRGLGDQLRELGLPGLDEQAVAELDAVRTSVSQPGPFTVLVHRDSCPDNVIVALDGVRLIDFEFARPGHALLDGLYPQLPFPTCWCCNRLPSAVEEEVAAAYRAELIAGVPEAADDRLYDDAVSRLMAYWLIASFEWTFAGVLTESRTWGIASVRARELSRLQVFVGFAERTGAVPGLRGVAQRLLAELTRRWPGEKPLAVYPALRAEQSG
ncbi:phosphotransferase [Microlunatus elymi]|nr:phosphotransferase [Microlunatus elymi]